MAEDADNDAKNSPRPRPRAPKPKRDSVLIEGEAREIRDEGAAPANQEAAGPAPATEAQNAPEPAPTSEGLATPDFTGAAEPFGEPEPRPEFAAADRAFGDPAADAPPPESIAAEPASTAPPPPPRGRAGSFAAGIVAGVVGAAIALVAAWFFDPRAGAIDSVESQVQALQQADQRDAQADKTLEGRVAALENARPGTSKSPELAALEKKVAQLEAAKPESGALDPRVAALEANAVKPEAFKSLEQRLAALESSGVKPESLTTVENEAHEAKEAADKALALASGASAASSGAAAPAAAPSPEPDPRVATLISGQQALEARVAKDEKSLDDRLSKNEAATSKSIAELDDRLTKSNAALGDRIGQDAAKLSDRLGNAIDDLKNRVGKLDAVVFAPKVETRVPPAETAEDAQKQARASTRAIASVALLQRLKAGEPYQVELNALSRAGADAGALADLKPLADSGAPTVAALAAKFRQLEPEVLAAGKPAAAEGAMGHFMSQMSQLVNVRRVGETPGETPEALVTQVEGAMSRGDISAALAAYQKLPEASRAVAANWAKSAQERAKADAAAKSLRDSSIAELDKSNQ